MQTLMVKLKFVIFSSSSQFELKSTKNICTLISFYRFQFVLDIDECQSQPCQNGGTCVGDIDSYNCNCLQFYTGRNCEIGNIVYDRKIEN